MKYRGIKLIIIWVMFIAGGWIVVYGVSLCLYHGGVWMAGSFDNAIAHEENVRAKQVRDRVADNTLDFYLRRK